VKVVRALHPEAWVALDAAPSSSTKPTIGSDAREVSEKAASVRSTWR